MPESLQLVLMQVEHQPSVVELIGRAMDDQEAAWAKQTFDFHFSCQQQDIDSKRRFYIAIRSENIAGIVGLHEYRWGPPQNIWLSWFAVEPNLQGQGIGKWLLRQIEQNARELGYTKMFIETYEHPTFARALKFYQAQDYVQQGEIQAYLPDNSAMLVYSKSLT